ncbi:hypothetical protein V1460_27790 [Streptomyces sp. SCSIO 30461]|uniref:hypothetical protein n=1 Tax=Streptomyces sp. SCSIO 30461 TaxID=3118085 RepID=UPI0030D32DF4
MNIRSLSRGDGVVIGAAVLLFIASFLNTSECSGTACDVVPNAWGEAYFLGWGTFFLGIAGAALIIVSRLLPQSQPRKVAGIELAQAGTVLTIATAWQLLMWMFEAQAAGGALILGLIASLVLAGAAVAGPLVPALKLPLMPAPSPAAPQPYGAQPQAGYGYPGAPMGSGQGGGYGYPGAGAQQSPQPQPMYGGAQPQPQQDATPAPAGDFAPFWFAVPVARPLYAEDGSPVPIAELAPGTWYLAVEQRGPALVAQTQDGRRGVLQDTTGIQRG